MAEFSMLVTTKKGQELIAKMLSGEQKIIFTKVSSSDAEYTVDQLEGLEEITSIKQSNSVSKVSRTNDTTVKVEAVFTNTDLTEGYYMRTIALYAKNEESEDVLYAVAIETSGNCYVPAFSGITVSGAYIQLSTTVSNAENVTVEVDNSVFATIGNIKDIQEQIDALKEQSTDVASDLAAHAEAININAGKLELLEKIGARILRKEIRSSVKCTFSTTASLETITEGLDTMNDKTYYLYVLSGYLQIPDFLNDYPETYGGAICININIGSGDESRWEPISHGLVAGYYMCPVNLIMVSGPPSNEGIDIRIQPIIYKHSTNGKAVDVTQEFTVTSLSMDLKIFKLGGILATVGEGGTSAGTGSGTGGVTSYRSLADKPSINNVTLIGNLTSDDLGLGDGSGSEETASEMTYEETLAELNKEASE